MRAEGPLPGETAVRRVSFRAGGRRRAKAIIANAVGGVYMAGPGGLSENKPVRTMVRVLQAKQRESSFFRGDGNLPVLSRGRHIRRAPKVAARGQRCGSANASRPVVRASAFAGDQVRGHCRRGRTPPAAMRRRSHEMPDSADAPAQIVTRHRGTTTASLSMALSDRTPVISIP